MLLKERKTRALMNDDWRTGVRIAGGNQINNSRSLGTSSTSHRVVPHFKTWGLRARTLIEVAKMVCLRLIRIKVRPTHVLQGWAKCERLKVDLRPMCRITNTRALWAGVIESLFAVLCINACKADGCRESQNGSWRRTGGGGQLGQFQARFKPE